MLETVRSLHKRLDPIYGHGEAEAIIRIMFHYLKGWTPTDMVIHEDSDLSPFILRQIDGIVGRLLAHEPIQYITGEGRFYGMTLHLTPDVLIPRPETEELTDMIVDGNRSRSDLRVLDIATGSGCIAIALARNLPFARVTAIDVSEKALAVARDNARELHAAVDFINADMCGFTPPHEGYDIIVSNPPYIGESEAAGMERNVLDHEPHGALFVPDSDPLVYYREIARIGSEGLAPGGRLYLEINPLHASELAAMLAGRGYSGVEVRKDCFGRDRFITATFSAGQ